MVNVFDVRADELIKNLSQELRKMSEIKPPEWSKFAKSGPSRKRPPENDDFWFVRAASILRQIYIMGRPIGTQRLKTKYGGKVKHGKRTNYFRKGSGSIIRKILQQLEKEGLIEKKEINGTKGRVLTPKGKSLVDKKAAEIFKNSKL